MSKKLRLLSVSFLWSILLGVFSSAHAVEVKYLYRIPYIKFSLSGDYLRNPDGSIFRGPDGKPVYEWRVDPPAMDGIAQIGFDFGFDASRYEVLSDQSTWGFLCAFSQENVCPSEPPIAPATYGSPLSGSIVTFDIGSPGRALFSYDFSDTPVSIQQNVDFFAFQMKPLTTDESIPVIVQHSKSPAQYCKTTASTSLKMGFEPYSNDCGDIYVPEPTTISLVFLAFLGIGLTMGRHGNTNP